MRCPTLGHARPSGTDAEEALGVLTPSMPVKGVLGWTEDDCEAAVLNVVLYEVEQRVGAHEGR